MHNYTVQLVEDFWQNSQKKKNRDLMLNISKGLHSSSLNFHYQPRFSVDSGSFISGTNGKSCSVRLAMADRGCICINIMVMCRFSRISVWREKSQMRLHSRTSFYFYKIKCSCLVNKVVYFIIRPSTCFHHSVV